MSPKGQMTRERGFTLTELMIVVAIVGVFSAVLFGIATRPYTANAKVTTDELVTHLSFARMRAVSTRKVHRVTIYNAGDEQIAALDVYPTKGMSYDATATTWQTVTVKRFSKDTIIQDVLDGALLPAQSPTLNASLNYSIYFKPDGSATAATIFVTDRNGTPHYYKVLVYNATGSSYARETW